MMSEGEGTTSRHIVMFLKQPNLLEKEISLFKFLHQKIWIESELPKSKRRDATHKTGLSAKPL